MKNPNGIPLVLETILARRSIRRYSEHAVSRQDLDLLLQAAMSAPSAGNQQPWHFIVLRDRIQLDAIPDIHPYAGMAREAPLAIVVCGDPSLERYPGYWVQDCSAAVENLLLAAHALGLGAVWCGIHPDQGRVAAFQRLLNIPATIIPLALVPVGHPGERKPPADRYNSERVRFDRWTD